MAEEVPAGDYDRQVRRYTRISYAAIALLLVGFLGWAMLTEVAGAVIAGGTVVVKTSAKRVQHQEGGIVAEFYVVNDDAVTAGQPLLRLDDTTIRASLAVVENQLDEASAIEARLVAEVAGRDHFDVPAILSGRESDPRVVALLEAQRGLQAARASVRTGSIMQLQRQIEQLEAQGSGYRRQTQSLESQLALTRAELDQISGLLDQQLVGRTRVNELTRQSAQTEGELGALQASIDQATASIAERRVMIEQVDTKFLSDALTELQATREKIAQLLQQRIAGRDRLSRVTIVAPQTGIVHESTVHTVGGVVTAGETLMMIVPTDDDLLVETHLNPLDVDKVKVGQAVVIRIPGLNPRTTPDLHSRVVQVAPDLTTDPQTGAKYYLARVQFGEDALAILKAGERLVPGMPAEAYVQTGTRTVMTYLLEPLTEQFRRAMREQ